MADNTSTSLAVSIKELPSVHVAYIDYKVDGQGEVFNAIRESFQRVQAWVKQQGHDPFALTVGIPHAVNEQLTNYECCAKVPEEVQTGSDGIDIKDLVGGRYAVVHIADKNEPGLVGSSIGRFFGEYVPQNRIEIDVTRPTYEIYYETIMEFCVPIR